MAKELGTQYVRVVPKVSAEQFSLALGEALEKVATSLIAAGADGVSAVPDDVAAARVEVTSEPEALAAEVERMRVQRDQARDLAVAFQQEADHNEELLAKRADEAKDAIRGVLLELHEVLHRRGIVTDGVLREYAARHGVML